jgi:hypothetical protein
MKENLHKIDFRKLYFAKILTVNTKPVKRRFAMLGFNTDPLVCNVYFIAIDMSFYYLYVDKDNLLIPRECYILKAVVATQEEKQIMIEYKKSVLKKIKRKIDKLI